jgi:hypothetical protein
MVIFFNVLDLLINFTIHFLLLFNIKNLTAEGAELKLRKEPQRTVEKNRAIGKRGEIL